ncbi:BgTH12-00254 [Blumeria graminis f. sp. triticale]|uniref:BgtA-20304 n=3 Tax=Blumeria graminis TaxID=34373 RepID=A0A9X9MLE3_BLUGR|nr:hypothetical protein BGT96224_A20304 [Blumeria graminis f. sp. tritici 96224]CAD6504751.1 BgTH12-00254 [Blumeria graminis f. sp. triticale]VDB92771.1 BgtA-20304 [Blumeria graminis f. sp. tritici]
MSSGSTSTGATAVQFSRQNDTAEDLLRKQTEGLVALSEFRQRRAEAIETKERDAQAALLAPLLPQRKLDSAAKLENAGLPSSQQAGKKRKQSQIQLSFQSNHEEEQDEAEGCISKAPMPSRKAKVSVNSSVAHAPKALTKAARQREAQMREYLRKEFLLLQDAIKNTEIAIPFVFYDGTNIPGGVCRVRKSDYVWVFLDRSRKAGAELKVAEKVNSKREWARIGVDDLMLVRGDLIIPHHYEFYYFIINHILGPNNRLLFGYSSEPPAGKYLPNPAPSSSDFNPLTQPLKPAKSPSQVPPVTELEGQGDDPTFTKVVDRRWYERNKHIFPASVWQEYDPEKDYQKEVKRDLGGNTFFFP